MRVAVSVLRVARMRVPVVRAAVVAVVAVPVLRVMTTVAEATEGHDREAEGPDGECEDVEIHTKEGDRHRALRDDRSPSDSCAHRPYSTSQGQRRFRRSRAGV